MSDSVDKPAKAELPSRRAPEAYWKRATPDPRILRRWFGRRALLDLLREMVWLAPLTAVIWIYAEREQVKSVDVDTSVAIVSADRSRYVETVDGAPLHVVLTLSGPQSVVDKVREQLTSGIPRGVSIDIGENLPAGRHQFINVLDHIQDQPEFKSTGVTITKSVPPQVAVNVDVVKDYEVDVQIPPRVDNLTSATTFEPRKVHLRGPADVLDRLREQGNLKVYADIAGSDVLRTPGKKDLPSVPLTLSQPESGLTIEPPNVHATLDVRAADIPGTIPSVPIAIETLPGILRNNDVVLGGGATLANVRVIGPPEVVAQLVGQLLPARAVVDVDATGQTRIKFELPEGVRPAPGETERPIDVTLHRRDNGG